jgi:hypothetical protein
MLTKKSEIRDVTGISEQEKQKIIDFLQGAVYCWCNNKKDDWFSARDFLGGENYYWQGTPLITLYEKHQKKGKDWETSAKDAGKDAGWLLKRVIDRDKRSFETKEEDLIRKYRWTGDEKND